MKKSILVFCAVLVAFSLMAFGIMNWKGSLKGQKEMSCNKSALVANVDDMNNWNSKFLNSLVTSNDLDLIYNVDSRFLTTVSKDKLLKAKSIIDILPAKATESATSFYDVEVAILDEGKEGKEFGDTEVLNKDQVRLLQTVDYTSDIFIKADYTMKNLYSGFDTHKYLTYYISITPENQAQYIDGHDALIDYLKKGSKEEVGIIQQDKLRPGRVNFTVTKEGTLANVKLDSSCGYASVDEKLVTLVANMSTKWRPATNANGEKVDQELVFFFGLQGC